LRSSLVKDIYKLNIEGVSQGNFSADLFCPGEIRVVIVIYRGELSFYEYEKVHGCG